MKIFREVISISTNKRCEMIDITDRVQSVIGNAGISDGVVIVCCPHTTAGITINENADTDVIHDILMTLEELLPKNRKGYRHGEGNSDSHVKSSLTGCSENILFGGGRLILGTWQGIFFCEFDGPRSRKVIVQIQGQ